MKVQLNKSNIKSFSELKITGSKSESNRVLLLQALFERLEIKNLSNSDDSQLMQKALSVDDTGASSIKGLDLLIAQNLDLEASGASNAKLIANGRIKAKLSGASSFKYAGDAKHIKINATGASRSRRL